MHFALRASSACPRTFAVRCSTLGSSPGTSSSSISASAPNRHCVQSARTMASSASFSEVHFEVHCEQARLAEVQKAIAQVHSEGYTPHFSYTDGSSGSGTQTAFATQATFKGGLCQSALRTKLIGRLLLTTPLITSTQDFMRANSLVLGDGTVLVADKQSSGKGRGGNVWTSPDGCLMFSAGKRLRMKSPAQAPYINYVVCLAVRQGIFDTLQPLLQGAAMPPVHIKWPNDIYVNGLKIGGVLIHTTWQSQGFNIITGIGLNVNNQQPTTCLDSLLHQALAAAPSAASVTTSQPSSIPTPPTTSIAVSVPSVSREAVLAGILNRLEEYYDVFEQQGFEPLAPLYLEAWLHSGQVLRFQDTHPGDPTGPPRTTLLTVKGLSDSGYLLAEDESGVPHELTPDGNSLDMMAGLIRRKLPL